MARRRESSFELLSTVPWYVGAGIAVTIYLVAPTLAAHIARSNPIFSQAAPGLVMLANTCAFVCLAAAGLSALRKFLVRRKFAEQRSLKDLRALSWQQFEAIVAEGFRRRGYQVLETGQGGPDGGIDLVLRKEGKRYLVQCKQYRATSVGVSVVRELYGVTAAQQADGAIVVTTGRFTPDAQAFARSLPIELIDGPALESMVRDIHGLSSQVPMSSQAASIDVARAAASIAASGTPSCPKCSAPMIERRARSTGKRFWGCSTFPRCRATQPIN